MSQERCNRVYIHPQCEKRTWLRLQFEEEEYTTFDITPESNYIYVSPSTESDESQLADRCQNICEKENVVLVSESSLFTSTAPTLTLRLTQVAKALSGQHICCSRLHTDVKTAIKTIVGAMGGTYQGDLTNNVTHLVTKVTSSKKYEAAIDHGKQTVSTDWVWECFKAGCRVPEENFRVGPMVGSVVCVTGLDAEERQRVEKLVEMYGGTYSRNLTLNVNFLVAKKANPNSAKFNFALENSIPIVKLEWIDAKIARNGVQIYSEFLITEEQKESTQNNVNHAESTNPQPFNIRATPSPTYSRQQATSKQPTCSTPSDPIVYDNAEDMYLECAQVSLVHLSTTILERCKQIVIAGGGTYFINRVSSATTAIVAPSLAAVEQALGEPKVECLVGIEWLEECYRQRCKVPLEKFFIRKVPAHPSTSSSRKFTPRPNPLDLGPTAFTNRPPKIFAPEPTPPLSRERPRTITPLLREHSESTHVSNTMPTPTGSRPASSLSRPPTPGETDFKKFLSALSTEKQQPMKLSQRLAAKRLQRSTSVSHIPEARAPSPANAESTKRAAVLKRRRRIQRSVSVVVESRNRATPSPTPANEQQRSLFLGLKFALGQSSMPLQARLDLGNRIKNCGGIMVEIPGVEPRTDRWPDYIVSDTWLSVAKRLCRPGTSAETEAGRPLVPASVTPSWVEACCQREILVPVIENFRFVAAPKATLKRTRNFQKLIISVSGFKKEEREFVKSLTQASGATYTEDMRRTNTHLICKTATGNKFKRAPRFGVKVVNALWLFDSIRYMQPLHHDHYALPDMSEADNPSGSQISLLAPKADDIGSYGSGSFVQGMTDDIKGTEESSQTNRRQKARRRIKPLLLKRKDSGARSQESTVDLDIGKLFSKTLSNAIQNTTPKAMPIEAIVSRDTNDPNLSAGSGNRTTQGTEVQSRENSRSSAKEGRKPVVYISKNAVKTLPVDAVGRFRKLCRVQPHMDMSVVYFVVPKSTTASVDLLETEVSKENVREDLVFLSTTWVKRSAELGELADISGFQIAKTSRWTRAPLSSPVTAASLVDGKVTPNEITRKRQKTWQEIQREDNSLFGCDSSQEKGLGRRGLKRSRAMSGSIGDDSDGSEGSDAVMTVSTTSLLSKVQERKRLMLEKRLEAQREKCEGKVFLLNELEAADEDFLNNIGAEVLANSIRNITVGGWTHFVTSKLNRSLQVVLAIVATGTWLLSPSYIAESRRLGELAPEKDHEWIGRDPNSAAQRRILEAAKKWKSSHPFSGWRVLLKAQDDRAYNKAILIQGGAKIISRAEVEMTHVFFDDEKQFTSLSECNRNIIHEGRALCLKPGYIVDYIITGGDVEADDYVFNVAELKIPARSSSNRKTSRKKSEKSVRRRSSRRRSRINDDDNCM